MFGAGFTDGAGDRVTTMTVQGPVERIEVVVEGTVETTDTAGVLRGHRETISPRVYLRPTSGGDRTGRCADLEAGRAGRRATRATLGRAHRLSSAVAEAIAYAPGAHRRPRPPPPRRWSTGAGRLPGPCPRADRARAARRACPARYVTGYLLTGDERRPARRATPGPRSTSTASAGSASTPANRCCPDERYIRLGSGRDAREAAPIRGVSRGGGSRGDGRVGRRRRRSSTQQ